MDERLTDDFDPNAPEDFDSPHALYRELRQRCPMAHSNAFGGFWTATKYQDVFDILSDSKTFGTSVQNVVPKVAFTGRRPPLHFDPPDHTPYRRALNPLFRDERMAVMEPKARRIAAELLMPLIEKGRGDICLDFSYLYPTYVFAEFINLPNEEIMKVREILSVYNRALQYWDDELVKKTSLMLYEIARDIVALRKKEPMDPSVDPASAMLAARHKGEPLPDDMIVGTIRQFLVVGMLAPSVSVGAFVVHLSRHPNLQDRLRKEPHLIPHAIEELLRLYSPYRGFCRTANKDVVIGGRLIKKDEPIALLFTSADRDEDVFENPDEFDLDRPQKKNLAFGMGPHQCAGIPLARLELKVALEEILVRTKHIEVDGPVVMTKWPEYGPLEVPVRLVPA